jgi:hypothetical protein
MTVSVQTIGGMAADVINTRVLAALVAVTTVAAGCSSSHGTHGSSNSTASPSVAHTKDVGGDVKFLRIETASGITYADFKVTNHSSQRSNYVAKIALVSADGSVQLATGRMIVEDLEPGQTRFYYVPFTGLDGKPIPSGAKAVVVSVNRLAP